MISRRCPLRCLVVVFGLLLPASSPAIYVQFEPNVAAKAFFLLLTSADAVIPETSGCYGEYGQTGEPTVRDLLGRELADLRDGKTAVESSCKSNRCTITMSHQSAQEPFAATFEFAVIDGKLDVQTLECGMLL